MPRRKLIQAFWASIPGRWEEVWLAASLLAWSTALVATSDFRRSPHFKAFLEESELHHSPVPPEYLWASIPVLLLVIYVLSMFRTSPRLRAIFRASLVFWNTFVLFTLLLTGAGLFLIGIYVIQAVIASRLVLSNRDV